MSNMSKSTFKVAAQKSCICLNFGEVYKNHGTTDHFFDSMGEGRVYATNTTNFHVKCFERFKAHLNPIRKALCSVPVQQ